MSEDDVYLRYLVTTNRGHKLAGIGNRHSSPPPFLHDTPLSLSLSLSLSPTPFSPLPPSSLSPESQQ